MEKYKDLILHATKAREKAYAPYSAFSVGAALLCKDGSVYTGCNVENASYSETVCAERTAVLKAVSQGKRDFSAIAIVGGKNDEISDFVYPCGSCRQVLREFCNEDFEIVLSNGKDITVATLSQLLPKSFNCESIK